jgi:hypothetical protein
LNHRRPPDHLACSGADPENTTMENTNIEEQCPEHPGPLVEIPLVVSCEPVPKGLAMVPKGDPS